MSTQSPENGPTNRLTLMLDEIERRVENMRSQAAYLEEEKACLLKSLHNLQESSALQQLRKCEREEIEINADRLVCRCLTVDISITIPRSNAQEDALRATEKYIEKVIGLREGRDVHTQSLINACASDQHEYQVSPDAKFQTLLMGCTAEDQKNIHKRLKQSLGQNLHEESDYLA